ncbi:hypothetical protein PCASD_01516 [Puccinia coronata f. sp. avenae]|uniref:DUF6818 domain-containing protein n=1 Tax=Puccinia coronata f. sp. avenae TaxID=200324 RepID=A0A2N5VIH9_9BASI|nr:hypothetical protein PCASD_01516 [Puccinia coronata f. sp. avenae]
MPPKQSTPASTQQTQASATQRNKTSAPGDNSQRRPGRAKGSQGYSTKDCVALIEAVKEHLPLGSQEWGYVLERYNTYAADNKRAIREQESIKLKFQALVKHTKPTGDPSCPSHIREAKLTQKAMDNRAHLVACNDDAKSDDDWQVIFPSSSATLIQVANLEILCLETVSEHRSQCRLSRLNRTPRANGPQLVGARLNPSEFKVKRWNHWMKTSHQKMSQRCQTMVQTTEPNQTTHPTLFCQPFRHGLPDPMSQRAPSNHLQVNWLPLRLKLGPTKGGALELLAKAAQ